VGSRAIAPDVLNREPVVALGVEHRAQPVAAAARFKIFLRILPGLMHYLMGEGVGHVWLAPAYVRFLTGAHALDAVRPRFGRRPYSASLKPPIYMTAWKHAI